MITIFKFVVALIFFCISKSFSQNTKSELFITANLNMYFPTNSLQEFQPIVQFSNPFSVGGFGIGATLLNPLNKTLILKNQANISFIKFKDTPVLLTDPSGQSLGNITGITRDLNLGITSTINYSLTNRFSMGAGLGLKILLDSRTNYNFINQSPLGTSINGYYKPIMPVFPIEATLRLKKMMFNLRYEYSILNKLKGDLSDYTSEKYSLISLEIGYKIK